MTQQKNVFGRPDKNLSQNFLINKNIQTRIIDACCLDAQDTVLEIGPGKGALSFAIAQRVKTLIAVEKDKELARALDEQLQAAGFLTQCRVVDQDILQFDFRKLDGRVKVIGNIPYHISSKIIERMIEYRAHISTAFLTVQYEFAMRLIASAGSKDYGSLSCFVQYFTDAVILFKIHPQAFYPAPKVVSCFIRLDFLTRPRINVKNEKRFFMIMAKAFENRRKTIENSLQTMIPKETLRILFKEMDFNPKARAEDFSLKDYAKIANALETKGGRLTQ